MRLDVHVVDVQPTAALTEYTQSRLWLGLQHLSRRVVCAGVWLTERSSAGEDDARRFVCRIDLWLRRIGHVTVRHVDDNPYVAVDLAVARMRHAVSRRLGRAACAAGVAGEDDERGDDGGLDRRRRRPRFDREPAPRLAVVIERRGRCAASSALPWLMRNHGVERLSRMTVTSAAWEAAADGNERAIRTLRDRLALALLGRPVFVVVLGSAGGPDAAPVDSSREESRVGALAAAIRRGSLPVEVIGLWMGREGEPHPVVEGPEIPAYAELDEHRTPPSRRCLEYARAEPALSHWLAQRVWEDDGGRHRVGSRVARVRARRPLRQRQRRELVSCE